MLTTRKNVVARIRNYIMLNYDPSGYENQGAPVNPDFPAVAKFIMRTFRKEKQYDNDKRGLSECDLFREWCAGLPSILDCGYYYNRSALSDAETITGERSSKYEESDAEEFITCLLYRELKKGERE